MYNSHVGKWPKGGGVRKCHFPPEGDTISNAITRKCKLGMLTYITMEISVCPSEWYQSAKFRVLAHALVQGRWCAAYDRGALCYQISKMAVFPHG